MEVYHTKKVMGKQTGATVSATDSATVSATYFSHAKLTSGRPLAWKRMAGTSSSVLRVKKRYGRKGDEPLIERWMVGSNVRGLCW